MGAFESAKGQITSIMIFTPQGQMLKKFPSPMLVMSVAWLPDGAGLLFVAAEKGTGLRNQIWFQPYPTGEAIHKESATTSVATCP